MTNPLPNADELEVVAWAYPQGEKLGVTTNRQTACDAFSGIANPPPLVTLSSAQAQIEHWRGEAARLLKSGQDALDAYETEKARAEAAEAEVKSVTAERDALIEALTPSGDTKGAYIGEFHESIEVANHHYDDEEPGEPETIIQNVPVSWTTIKEIMQAIRARSALSGGTSNG